MNRTPPVDVLESLRREVNFGCPVEGCGIPYLMWHHFDPAWHIKEHHNPKGMIALCATHQALADGGRWTNDQIRLMKRKPFVTGKSISAYYGYLRKKVVCNIGNLAYDAHDVLQINGQRVIGFAQDKQGFDRLNLLIRGSDNSVILKMKNNFLTAFSPKLYDLRCSAQGKEFELRSKDQHTQFEMRFDDMPQSTFRSKFASKNLNLLLTEMGNPASIPVWTIKGTLKWGGQWIAIRDQEVEDLKSHNVVAGGIFVRPNSGLSFDNRGFAIG